MGIRVKSSSFKGTDKWSWFQITRKSIQTPTDKEKKSERDKLFPTWFFNTTWGKNAERQQQVCPVCITTHYQVLMVKHQFLDPYCALQLPWQPLSSCDTAESPPNTTAHQPPKPLNSLIIWTLKTAPITTWLQAKIHCQMSCLGEMPTNITWTSLSQDLSDRMYTISSYYEHGITRTNCVWCLLAQTCTSCLCCWWREVDLKGSALPVILPWPPGSKVFSNGGFETTVTQEINPRDPSGPKNWLGWIPWGPDALDHPRQLCG